MGGGRDKSDGEEAIEGGDKGGGAVYHNNSK